MHKHYSATFFRKVLVPIIHEVDSTDVMTAARLVAGGEGRVLLKGLVGVAREESLSTGAVLARQVRKRLHDLDGDGQVNTRERVSVTHDIWAELLRVVNEESPDLLLLGWPHHLEAMHISPAQALENPPCDIALVRGPIPARPGRVLVALRGSPYAEKPLRLSLSISASARSAITALHLVPLEADVVQEVSYRGLSQVLEDLPDVERHELPTSNPAETILSLSPGYDLLVMGAAAQPDSLSAPVGPVAGRVLCESPCGVIILKTAHPLPLELASETAGQTAISVLVDKWFAENTYHSDEFTDLDHLLALKQRQNLTISLALPALNEEETVGNVINTVKAALLDQVPLLDELVLMDSDSTDRTRAIAEALGVPVYVHQQVLPRYGARQGKGEALWKSLFVTRGDLLVWIDTDIVNIHPRFVYGLLGPLLVNPRIQFVKGFYRRPLRVGDKIQAGGGGRVTELTARPLVNLFYPQLSGVIQPLSGEYGGRRSALEQLPFFSGYGVETGLLIEILEHFGLSAIAQVDLRERVHHNQSLESLSKMSFAIIQAVIRKLEHRYGQGLLEEVNKTMKLIRYEPGRFFLEVEEIAERERPPMIELPEYQERFSR